MLDNYPTAPQPHSPTGFPNEISSKVPAKQQVVNHAHIAQRMTHIIGKANRMFDRKYNRLELFQDGSPSYRYGHSACITTTQLGRSYG